MKKKDIKAFFKAIRDRDLAAVTTLVQSDKAYLSACNFAPPKKDDGQSGLQVAFKTGNFEIAQFLIDEGADVNFIEQSEVNEWRAPVLHDCIRATVFNSYTMRKDTGRFDRAFSILTLMLDKKADPNAMDSYGNNCLMRVFLDARQMIDTPAVDFTDDILLKQLRSVFGVLVKAGADVNQGSESVLYMISNYRMEKYQLL
jgi:hypothetical protein